MPGPGAGIAYAVPQTQIGIAVESVRGTPEDPDFWIPVRAPKYKPDLTLLPDETLQGSMVLVYDLVRGLRYDGHGWESYPYLDSFPNFIRAEFGSDDNVTAADSATTLYADSAIGDTTIMSTATIAAGQWIVIGAGGTLETHEVLSVAGSGSPFTLTLTYPMIFAQIATAVITPLTVHQFSLLNNSPTTGDQPPSYTITDFDGEQTRQLAACQLDELTIKGNGTSLTQYTCTWMGNPAVTLMSEPSPSFTDVPTPQPWTVQTIIGGTFTPTVMDWEFDFKRGTKPIPALTGSEGYFSYFAGPLQCSGKLSFVEQSGSPQLENFLNNTALSLDLSLFDGTTGFALNFHTTKMKYKTGEIDRSKEYVVVPIEFQLLPTSDDALAGGVSPVVVTIANSQSAAY